MTVRASHPAVIRFYEAFAADDVDALRAELSPSFRGVVAEGMPLGLGGTYASADEMVANVWVATGEFADVTPVPDEYLDAGDGRVVVVGRYRGRVRATDSKIDAAFVHLLRVDGSGVSELVQVTDTARWHAALAATGPRPDATTRVRMPGYR